jgi:hypothetical protein
MSKGTGLVALAALIGIAAAALARVSTTAQAPAAAPNEPQREHFQVVAGLEACLLCETTTGKTWVLQTTRHSLPVWLPVKRIDNEQEAMKWLLYERERNKENPK